MRGKIIKGIAGFYYVHAQDGELYECKAKGCFRNKKLKPLPGDDVEIEILNAEKLIGNISDIYDRRSELIRPAVANADQAMVVFAAAEPEPNLNLLDRFLVLMEKQGMDTIICFNKKDIVDGEVIEKLKGIYTLAGYKVLTMSILKGEGISELKEILKCKTTVLAGPSGVGKSSVMNTLSPDANMQTGLISEKIKRGRHTTRHSELICICDDTYLFDTPGFSSLYLEDILPEKLKDYFREFEKYEGECRFNGCIHINEPDCALKNAVNLNAVSKNRYDNYKLLYEELKGERKTYKKK